MKFSYLLLCLTVLLAGACHSVKVEGPTVTVPNPKPALSKAKENFTLKKMTSADLPGVLGGIIQSDSWIIYKDKQQEEFQGNVSYENDRYTFRSDYALSDRARNLFSARGQVFLQQREEDGSFYQAQAPQARYNYQTQKGELNGQGKTPVTLVYQNAKAQTTTATAQKVTFDLAQKIYILQNNVRVEHPTPQGIQIITARKATFRQAQNYALLEGHATVTDHKRTLQAQTIIYDGENNSSYAYGDRALATGTTEQGTFAIIADKVQSDNEGKQINLDGQVQGWLVSPKINDAAFNTKF